MTVKTRSIAKHTRKVEEAGTPVVPGWNTYFFTRPDKAPVMTICCVENLGDLVERYGISKSYAIEKNPCPTYAVDFGGSVYTGETFLEEPLDGLTLEIRASHYEYFQTQLVRATRSTLAPEFYSIRSWLHRHLWISPSQKDLLLERMAKRVEYANKVMDEDEARRKAEVAAAVYGRMES